MFGLKINLNINKNEMLSVCLSLNPAKLYWTNLTEIEHKADILRLMYKGLLPLKFVHWPFVLHQYQGLMPNDNKES